MEEQMVPLTSQHSTSAVEVHSNFFFRNFRTIQPGSLRGIVLFWIKLSLGSGVFVLPYYFKKFGLLGGILACILAVLANYFAIITIFEAANESKEDRYTNMIRKFLGEVG